MIGIVVLNYNDWKTTLDFVISINGYSCFDKIVIVDNCSTDDSFERLYHLKSDKIDVIKSHKNGGYGYGCECQRKSEPSAKQYLSHFCERILEPPRAKVTANT